MRTTVLSLCLLLLTSAFASWADEPVTMRTSTWSPYVDASLPEQGLAMELVTHIFSRAGYQVENGIVSITQAMEAVRMGKADIVGAAWRDDARDERYIYSEPYLINELIVVKRRSMKGRHYSIGAMADSAIGLIKDYAYGVDFAELPGVQLVYEESIQQNLANLLDNKVDFVVGDRRVIAKAIKESLSARQQELEVASISLPPRPLYIAGSRAISRPAGLVSEFNIALTEVKRDGSYQQIIQKWRERYPL